VGLVVILVRLPLKKVPKIFSYILWLPVFYRLLCPVSFKSAFSFLGALKKDTVYVSPDIAYQATPTVNMGIEPVNQVINQSLPAATPVASVNPIGVILELAAILWLVGALIFLAYGIVSYLKLAKRVRHATLLSEGVYESEQVDSPFVLGFIKPRIFLPLGMESADQRYVITHEKVHIDRKDHLVKQLAFVALVLHWFNPLVHLSFRLLTKDMEMSCDEAVMRKLGSTEKKGYSSSLLSLSIDSKKLVSPLAFGESNIKSRIKNILGYKKPVVVIVVLALILVVTISIGCMGDPVEEIDQRDEWASWLLENRTPYLGNASKVGNIASRLDYPEDVVYRGMSLQTEEVPYSITINLLAPTTSGDPSDYLDHGNYIDEAFILFSLVENVETVHFNLTDGVQHEVTFNRPFARGQMGLALYSYSFNGDVFRAFLDELETMVFLLPEQGFMVSFVSIEEGFMQIMYSSQASSNPNDYFSAYPEEVAYLVSQGDQTLRYIYAEFEKGDQNGLLGHLYKAVAEEILDREYVNFAEDTPPQYWYDLMKEAMQAVATMHDLEYVQEMYPKASLMLGESNYYYAYDMVMYADGQVEIGGQKLGYEHGDDEQLLDYLTPMQLEQMLFRAVLISKEGMNGNAQGMRNFTATSMSDSDIEQSIEPLNQVGSSYPIGINGPYMRNDNEFQVFVQLDDYYSAHILFVLEDDEPRVSELLVAVE
jgi:beta-lactamase regulating signal transducer with metallopeptidase domain